MNVTLAAKSILLVLVAAMGACATSADRPYQQIARAEASIEQAQQSRAQQFGASELNAAQDKLAKARTAADNNDNLMAARYAEQATLDANLAIAITRNRQAQLSVEELNRSIETLRQEISRNQSRRGEAQ
jgi:hypothetical protein